MDVIRFDDYFGNNNQLGSSQNGGRALVTFPVGDSNSNNAVFYIYYIHEDSLGVVVAYKGSISEFIVDDNHVNILRKFGLSFFGICGHAVDDEGWTQVYCLAELDAFGVKLLVFPIDTRSGATLETQLNNDALSVEVKSASLSGFDKVDFANSERRSGVTFPLEDKSLSLVLHSDSNFNYVFDANAKTMAKYHVDAEVKWGTNVVFATKASEKDKVNLGCDGDSGGTGGDAGGGTGGSVIGGSSSNNENVCTSTSYVHTLRYMYMFQYF